MHWTLIYKSCICEDCFDGKKTFKNHKLLFLFSQIIQKPIKNSCWVFKIPNFRDGLQKKKKIITVQLSIVTSETDDQKSECELACNFKKGTGLENELNDWIRPIRCI